MSRRIRRVGLDSGDNYTLQQTVDYDVDNPAATAASWGTAAQVGLMDQDFEQTGELEREGALLTFLRFPAFFSGALVKLRPSYAALDVPFLELWTRSTATLEWARRRRFALNSLFTGVRSGERKVFDLFLTTDLRDVGAVWITMDPGAVGTPVNRFIAIHLFGECNPDVTPQDPCEVDPDNCLDPPACLVHPEGVDENGVPCFTDPINPEPDPLPPVVEFPGPPPIDLCDEAAVAAFEATLTPEQLAHWHELIETVELDCSDDDECDHPPCDDPGADINPCGVGTTSPPCLPEQPQETYIDPITGEPACDPDKVEA